MKIRIMKESFEFNPNDFKIHIENMAKLGQSYVENSIHTFRNYIEYDWQEFAGSKYDEPHDTYTFYDKKTGEYITTIEVY